MECFPNESHLQQPSHFEHQLVVKSIAQQRPDLMILPPLNFFSLLSSFFSSALPVLTSCTQIWSRCEIKWHINYFKKLTFLHEGNSLPHTENTCMWMQEHNKNRKLTIFLLTRIKSNLSNVHGSHFEPLYLVTVARRSSVSLQLSSVQHAHNVRLYIIQPTERSKLVYFSTLRDIFTEIIA